MLRSPLYWLLPVWLSLGCEPSTAGSPGAPDASTVGGDASVASPDGSLVEPDASLAATDAGRSGMEGIGARVLVLDFFSFAEPHGAEVVAYYARSATGEYLPLDAANLPVRGAAAHGDGIPRAIATGAPGTELVLADIAEFEPAPCELAALTRVLQDSVRSLRELVRAHDVGFINFSAGHTRSQLAREFEHCAPSAGELDAISDAFARHWYEPLGALPRTVLVQAGPNIGDAPAPVMEGDRELLLDCLSLPHRIRVAVAPQAPASVPPEGLAWPRFEAELDADMRNLRHCVDVYLATGNPYAATSAAAPLVTAGLVSAVRDAVDLTFTPGTLRAAILPSDDPVLVGARIALRTKHP